MVSSTSSAISVLEPSHVSPLCKDREFERSPKDLTPLAPTSPADRGSAAKGAIIGILLGAGFWAAVLVVIFRH